MDTLQHLDEQRLVWDRKPLIRALYGHYHQMLIQQCGRGSIAEIGAGCASLKSSYPDILSIDIVASPWVDLVGDAERLPLADDSVGNLVLLDVLHHIRQPFRFLEEAARVLEAGGRLVMLEPGISPLSRVIYGAAHPEPIDMHADVFADSALSGSDPFDSNQAIPTLLFDQGVGRALSRIKHFEVAHLDWLGFPSYPLSGGFRPWRLLPNFMLGACLSAEALAPSMLRRWLGFRLFVVLRKPHPNAD